MRITLIALSALALGAAAPAAANDFVVQYSDLDLSSAKDLKTLDRRIDTASRKYCGADVQMTGSRIRGTGTEGCVASARKLAKEQLAVIVARETAKGG